MKKHELMKLQQQHGDVKMSEIIEGFNRPHKCPKCDGKGGEMIRYNGYPSGLPDSGFAEEWKHKFIPCDICEGHGYTKKLMKPIKKTEIIGYQEENE